MEGVFMGLDTPERRHWELDSYRDYLLLLARCVVPPPLRSQSEDFVQDTLARAVRNRDQFQGTSDIELRGWLRVILTNVVRERLRRDARQQANGGPDLSLQQALDHSSCNLERFLAADQSTPSRQMMREEQLSELAKALAILPDDQRQAIQLHHLEGLPVLEVGQRMGRSGKAVAGLLFRGLKALRVALRPAP